MYLENVRRDNESISQRKRLAMEDYRIIHGLTKEEEDARESKVRKSFDKFYDTPFKELDEYKEQKAMLDKILPLIEEVKHQQAHDTFSQEWEQALNALNGKRQAFLDEIERKRLEAERKKREAEEAKRLEEERKIQEEVERRLEEERKKQEEADRIAEEKKRQEEEQAQEEAQQAESEQDSNTDAPAEPVTDESSTPDVPTDDTPVEKEEPKTKTQVEKPTVNTETTTKNNTEQ